MKTDALEIEWSNGHVQSLKVGGKPLNTATEVTLHLRVGEVPRAVIDVIAADGYVRIDESDTEIRVRVREMDKREGSAP